MSYPSAVTTERLDLRPVDPVADLDALGRLFADPEGWWYDPPGRHTDLEASRRWLQRAAQRWDSDGLSYWTVRLREGGDVIRVGGDVIGVGGAQRHRSGAWNLLYRLDTRHQGRGYATELGQAAMQAAAFVDADAAFIAWAAEHNTPSRRVAERIGLVDRGLRIDASDGATRLAYADRELDDELMPPLGS
ncbi:MAG TPA: GNAT family N-acetyltransferase [Solirubrobacteraceae bacterium]|jgi:RimJ/RimL family protein N-acetyltransferase|nr:GNAT family N-acetyltransferase [Solirubrobacteraceae bacterium]